MDIGKLEYVQVKEIWKKETDFTKWLEENIDHLNDALGWALTITGREIRNGSFFADLLAKDEQGNKVIIENEFGTTDHDHLGKVLTHLSGFNAKIAIWICENPRPEHIEAINWLNKSSSANHAFYLVEVKPFRIGNSLPAPYFDVICSPNEEQEEIVAQTELDKFEFWKGLLGKAAMKTKLHSNISASKSNWIGVSSGISGLNYNYVIANHHATVELYIDKGKESEGSNKNIFDELLSHKNEIEGDFGGNLIWERLDNRRACRISVEFDYGLKNKEKWEELKDEMIEIMIRFERALNKHIKQLKN
jgi:hypothetical protein